MKTSKKTLSCLTVLVGITLMGMTAGNAQVTPISVPCEDITDQQTCQGQSTPKCEWRTATCKSTKGVECAINCEGDVCSCEGEGCELETLKTPHCVDQKTK